jgi:hypothetical protein
MNVSVGDLSGYRHSRGPAINEGGESCTDWLRQFKGEGSDDGEGGKV